MICNPHELDFQLVITTISSKTDFVNQPVEWYVIKGFMEVRYFDSFYQKCSIG